MAVMTHYKKRGKRSSIDLNKVSELAAKGLTNLQIAQSLGISQSTFYRWSESFPEFSDACAQGRAKGEIAVANCLYELALSGNITAIIFYLKCRCGWSEKGPKEQETESKPTIIFVNDLEEYDAMTAEEQAAYRREHSC